MEEENQKLVEAWLQYYDAHERSGDLKGETNVGDEHFWAIMELERLVKSNPELSWRLILEIFARTTSDYQRACLAAGLLEDILVRHGSMLIDRIEEIAAKDKLFSRLLAGVWQNDIDQQVWERLQRLVKNSGTSLEK